MLDFVSVALERVSAEAGLVDFEADEHFHLVDSACSGGHSCVHLNDRFASSSPADLGGHF